MSHSKPISSVLILRFSALGDVAMTIPAIYSVARQHPDAKFYVATQPFFRRIFINPPDNVNVIAFDLKEYKGAIGLWKLVSKLLALRPDCVADLHNVLRTWIIDGVFRMRGTRVQMLDKQRAQRKNQNLRDQRRPFIQRYFDVFNQLGLTCTESFSKLSLDGIDFRNSSFAGIDLKNQILIGFAPFARYLNKSYPFLHGTDLVRRLCSIPNVKVLVFGGKPDSFTVEMWKAEVPDLVSVIGQGTIEQELLLMSRLDLMISMDSANMHLASLVGTRVLSLWGGTTPSCGFMGWKQREEDALVVGLPCQPCTTAGSDGCQLNNHQCMHSLTPDMIVQRILDIISA